MRGRFSARIFLSQGDEQHNEAYAWHMIENESQQGDVAMMNPPVSPEPVIDLADDALEHHLSTADVIATLRELGPVVSTMAIASLILPGVMGALVLVGVLSSLGSLAVFQEMAFLVDPIAAARAVLIAAAAFAILMALFTGSILMPTYASATVAGSLFGLTTGSAVAMIGVTGGALIGYIWGHVLARGRVMAVIQNHERASIIHGAIIGRSPLQEGGIVALIRIPPNSPFALTNLLMSSTSVGLVPYLWGSAIGIAPRTIIAVWVGHTLKDAAKEGGSMWWTILKIGVGLLVFLVVYKILSRWAREALASAVSGGHPAQA